MFKTKKIPKTIWSSRYQIVLGVSNTFHVYCLKPKWKFQFGKPNIFWIFDDKQIMRFILAKTKMRIDIRKTQLILDFLENEVSWYCEDDLSKMDQKLPFSPLKSPNHAKINPIPPRRGGQLCPSPKVYF